MGKEVWIWLDPTRWCNLQCVYCYARDSHLHGRQNLTLVTLERIVVKLQSRDIVIRNLNLNWRGEPLVNTQFPSILSYTLKALPHVPIEWHTNGILLKRMSREIAQASIRTHRAFVSIDGGTEESHDRNRGRGTFRKTLDGLRALLNATEELPIEVGIYQLDFGLEESDYDSEYLELCSRCARVIKVLPVGPDHGGSGWGAENREAPTRQGACFWAGNGLCIDPDGNVSICVLSNKQSGIVGNIVVEQLGLILDRIANWRKTMNDDGRAAITHCKGCKKADGDKLLNAGASSSRRTQ